MVSNMVPTKEPAKQAWQLMELDDKSDQMVRSINHNSFFFRLFSDNCIFFALSEFLFIWYKQLLKSQLNGEVILLDKNASTIFKYTNRFLSFIVMVAKLTRHIFFLFLNKDQKDENPEISSKNELLYWCVQN